jgi:hypothetical protein
MSHDFGKSRRKLSLSVRASSLAKGIEMKQIVVILAILGFLSSSYGQESQFFEFNTSRFARVIGLGNAFTGLADDIESVYYNSSGLANLDYYAVAYSKGQGFTFIIDDYIAEDFAVVLPVFKKLGIFALSLNRLSLLDFDFKENIFQLHFARMLVENLSIGASINYYHMEFDSKSIDETSGNAFDMSVSALYIIPITSIPGIINETRFGLQMQNLLDSDVHYTVGIDPNPKHQTLRVGLSTAIIPKIQKQLYLIPLKLIIVADAVFYGSSYKFDVFQPNFGLELALFEILKFRYGRENEIDINSSYDYSPQHPVKRYGVGLTLPLHKLITNFEMVEISFDYSYSDWDNIDESNPIASFFSVDLPIRDSFSLKIYFQY